MVEVFAPYVFFIMFRESLEAAIIISVLLSFLKQAIGTKTAEDRKLYKKLKLQVWAGAFLGVFFSLAIGGAFIGVFYSLTRDIWSSMEDIWESVFYLIACIMISWMGLAMLRLSKMQDKWRVKIAEAILASNESEELKAQRANASFWKRAIWKITPSKKFTARYSFLILPFVTTLREGLEAVVFIGGVSLNLPATSYPVSVIVGLICGCAVGLIMYKGGNYLSMQIFLILATCFLYLVAAGLFEKAIWGFEMFVWSKATGGDAAENGVGPGSYDIRKSVWHVNCCNPESSGGWMIFNALLGWENSATYGSVISYNIYWLSIMVLVIFMLYVEKKKDIPWLPMFIRKKYFLKKDADVVRAKEAFREQAMLQRDEEHGAVNTVDDYEGSSSSASSKNNDISHYPQEKKSNVPEVTTHANVSSPLETSHSDSGDSYFKEPRPTYAEATEKK